MTDREEREEHIKRLEAALACEEKQSSGKCSKQTCDDNCALLYEQGNWGEWKETLRYAINSLKIDLKYDLLYEETSGQADNQADKPTTKNDVPDINVGKIESTTKDYLGVDYLGVDAVSRQEAIDTIRQLYLDLASQKAVIDILKVLSPVTPQEPKWIPVSERLPEESGEYLTYVDYADETFISNHIYLSCYCFFSFKL